MAGIFISYRRQESTKDARSLYERLRGEFGREGVFIDLEGLDYGVDFVESLGRQLEGCRVLLALIGPHWLTAKDARGRRRIDDENDFVRIEVRTALERGIRVVPVLIDGAPMPVTEELPADLQRLVRLQALDLDFKRFDQDVGRLVSVLRKLLGQGETRPQTLMSPPPPPPASSGHWKSVAMVSVVVAAGAAGYALKPGPVPVPVPPVTEQVPPAPPPDPFPTGKQFRDCEDAACPVMVVIPAGSFLMGSPANEKDRSDDEGPQHRVSVAKFAMGQYEVTQGQWKALMGNNPSRFTDCGDKCPVDNVSWDMAQEFVKKLSAKTGQKYRLPSEAEWEYAARAGTTTAYAFGATLSASQANFSESKIGKTVQVGSYAANGFGLRDMHGNVWEWVQDCWHDNYQGAPANGRAWETECNGEARRVLRGGAWDYHPRFLRSAIRNWGTPDGLNYGAGFRVARTFSL